MIDHAIPPKQVHAIGTVDYYQLFWDERYWIAACRGCNTRKGDKLPHVLAKAEPDMYERMTRVLKQRGIDI